MEGIGFLRRIGNISAIYGEVYMRRDEMLRNLSKKNAKFEKSV